MSRYCEIAAKSDPDGVDLLRRKLSLQPSNLPSAEPRKVKNQRMKEYLQLWEDLGDEQRLKLASHDAKLNHIARLMRNIGTTEVVQAHNKIKATTAGSFDYVLRRFREEGVTARQLQRFIDENAVAWFSLTGHPTNPTTVEYTKAQIELARVIADTKANSADLDKALDALAGTPIIGERKTPIDEAEEIIATLHVIYDTALSHKNLFEESLFTHGYTQEGVKINRPLIVPCAWTLGDGDGNPSLTAEVLRDGIQLHRQHIARRYEQSCDEISKRLNDKELAAELDKIKTDIGRFSFKEPEDLIARIEALSQKAEISESRALCDLSYLVKCFRLGFATIDIRHNAIEIMETIHTLGALHSEDLKNFGLDQMEVLLTQWLADDKILGTFSNIRVEDFLSADDEAGARIFGRLQVIGKNPDMCDKLIIAETTHPAHALAALLLLKITGNKVGEEGSRIDITILSESVKDLMRLGNTLEDLLENENFRRHAVSRKRLLVMIAKSDTTRQDGRGEAEYMQYETAVDIYRVADKMRRKYPELDKVKTSIKNGGGHALQRGGGRVTEIAALHGRAAADARVTDCGPSTLTIQGEQLTILFCPGKVAIGTLEAFVAQNLYTKAGVRGEMPVPRFGKNINKQYAQGDAWLYAKTAGSAFDRFTKKSDAIDHLLIHAPWLAMKAGNVSSRPAKRGEKAVEPGITPFEAKGEDPKALQGRAISGERLTAHACLPIFSVLGLVEAMEVVRSRSRVRENPHKYGEALHHLYRAHKIHRDGARVTINAVVMADFDIAWPLLTGKIRPSPKQVAELAVEFNPEQEANAETTLAFLEEYFLEVEKLSFEMVSGQKAPKVFKMGDALRILWPELAEQVALRDQGAEFARVIECYRTRQFDKRGDQPLSEIEFRITQALYASANVVNAPVGILATRTRLEPVNEFKSGRKTKLMRPKSFSEAEVHEFLKIPAALQ
ncbi:MAG: phosphoenolpyruvate carboxylase [Micavibrio aeruginosavorus]|uniref:Phosphoenolpyruvate carboxylase n=1 Tax=Micavibrio aeruginosavorus TaxID=349221 RepID=A0A2W5FMV3_9BACT|nr:MAG: phosphoenolpyruvate carboxylase [Micavibrio aeruginosavorus]